MKTFAFLLVFAVPALAADDYELRMSRPAKVGDRKQNTGKVSEVRKMSLSMEGQPVKAEQTEINLDYVTEVEVLAVAVNGRPTSRRVKLVKLAGDMNGEPATQLTAGDEIVVTRNAPGPEGKEVTVNNAPATREQDKLISAFVWAGDVGDTTDDEIFGTQKRIKPGDEWPVNPEKAARKMTESGFHGIDPTGVTGSGKLIAVLPVEGLPCLHVRGHYEIKGSGMDLPMAPPRLKVSKYIAKAQAEGFLPVDVNDTVSPSNTIVVELDITAEGEIDDKGQKRTLQFTLTAKSTRTENHQHIK